MGVAGEDRGEIFLDGGGGVQFFHKDKTIKINIKRNCMLWGFTEKSDF